MSFRAGTAVVLLLLAGGVAPSGAQRETPGGDEGSPRVTGQVEVEAVSSDHAIDRRLTGILSSTGWFSPIEVTVRQGVVFLDGRTDAAEYRRWAGELAGNTRDVVAVVNRIGVVEPSPWDLGPALEEMRSLWNGAVRRLPLLGLGLLLLAATTAASRLVAVGARRALGRRLKPLLSDVAARALAIPVFLLGLYLVLQVAGLSRLAATVLGGTGLAGLVAGIAFRDILENFLASVLISVRNPFRIGDLVEIVGHTGIVQRVTTRGTVLMDLDGNHVQVPNATVYKSTIRNFTANPNRRESFGIGVGYEDDLVLAQEVARDVLDRHPAVLNDPESLVLVDRLDSATVNLRVYFWYDGASLNGPKIKSSVIRLVKRAFEEHGISMPDDAREVIFPDGVPVRMVPAPEGEPPPDRRRRPPPRAEPSAVTTAAEGDLTSEREELREQARRARVPEEGPNLLEGEEATR